MKYKCLDCGRITTLRPGMDTEDEEGIVNE